MLSVMMLMHSVSATVCRGLRTMNVVPLQKHHLVVTSSQPRQIHKYPCIVTNKTLLSSDVVAITLKPLAHGFNFKAGQWVDFMIPACNIVGGYSMCSSPDKLAKEGLFELAVKFSDWPPTLWIHEKCDVGKIVQVRVGGDFFYSPETYSLEHLLLIAGGIGINPLKSILLSFANLLEDNKIHRKSRACLLHSARSVQDLLFQLELESLCKKYPENIFCNYFVTREKLNSSEVEKKHELGRVKGRRIISSDVEEALENASNCESVKAYLCGPSAMISQCQHFLRDLSVSDENVYFEQWW